MAKKKKPSSRSPKKNIRLPEDDADEGGPFELPDDIDPHDREAIDQLLGRFAAMMSNLGPDADDEGTGDAMNDALSRAFSDILDDAFDDEPGDEEAAKTDPALRRALDLVAEAYGAHGARQVKLAQEAVAASPKCVEGRLLLAENAKTPAEAVRHAQQAVTAGELLIGSENFEGYVGAFWSITVTRPYMTARMELARYLRGEGRLEDAVGHYREMLRLNPGDDQRMRYPLAMCYADLNRFGEIGALLATYDDDEGCEFQYLRALAAYREEGDAPNSRRLLKHAKQANRYVPEYLTGKRPLPEEMPPMSGFAGDKDEGAIYAADWLRHWRETPGAIPWLRKTLKVSPTEPKEQAPEWGLLARRLRRLDREADEVWEVDAVPAPSTASEETKRNRAWTICIYDQTHSQMIAVEVESRRPSSNVVWECLVQAMCHPTFGSPHRPGKVVVRSKAYYNAWRSKLREIEVEPAHDAELPGIDRFAEEAAQHFGGRVTGSDLVAAAADVRDVEALPAAFDETWQAEICRMPMWVAESGEPHRPWGLMVTCPADDAILGQHVAPEPPEPREFVGQVLTAMRRPTSGDPRRPAKVEVRPGPHADLLKQMLEPLGVECVECDELEHVNKVLQTLAEHFAGPTALKPLIGVPGITSEQLAGFYESAALFYRQRPWRLIPGDAIIEMKCNHFTSGPWYVVVMGQSGLTLGLAIYEDREGLLQLMTGDSPRQEMRNIGALSLLYNECFEVPIRDLDAIERNDWAVADPEAYPTAMHVNPGLAVRLPLKWELHLLEGCLKAIPQFLRAGGRHATYDVPTSLGSLSFELSRDSGEPVGA